MKYCGISCEKIAADTSKSPFSFSFWRSNLISCDTDARKTLLFFLQFFPIEPHFVRKVCRGHFKVAILTQFFWRSNLISYEKVAADTSKSQFYFISCRSNCISCEKTPPRALQNRNFTSVIQFLRTEPYFVRKGCILRRLVGTAPRLTREIEKKEREEARGQESTRAREQEGRREKMRRCEDKKMRRCEDEKV